MITTRRHVRHILLILAAVFALVGATGAAASPPTRATGSFTTTSATFNNSRTVGSTTIYDLTSTVSYTGTLSGTSIVHGILIIDAAGSAKFHDIETFTGTVNGATGTVTFDLVGKGSVAPLPGSYLGAQTILSGTGDLANLRGVVRQVGTVPSQAAGPVGTYVGEIEVGKN